MTHHHLILGPITILRPGTSYDRGKDEPERTVWVRDENGVELEVLKRLIEKKEE